MDTCRTVQVYRHDDVCMMQGPAVDWGRCNMNNQDESTELKLVDCLQDHMRLTVAQLAGLAQAGYTLFQQLRDFKAQRDRLAERFTSVSQALS